MTYRRKLLILSYHRVVSEPDRLRPGLVDRGSFESQMNVLRQFFNVLPLRDAHYRLQEKSLPSRAVAITFDDGYADNAQIALPILKKFGLSATFFVATGYLNGGRMWNDTVIEAIRLTRSTDIDLDFLDDERLRLDSVSDRSAAIRRIIKRIKYLPTSDREAMADRIAGTLNAESLPTDLMMTDGELRNLHKNLMEIGGHTVSHPILSEVSTVEARKEIVDGKDYLAERLGTNINSFAYPNGRPGQDYHANHVDVVRESGFELAVSTAWGPARSSDDVFQLPRVGFAEARPTRFCTQLLRSYFAPDAARV